MNINLAQANGVCLTRWQMRALKHLAGAKARVDFGAICGTTKVVPCYKAQHRPYGTQRVVWPSIPTLKRGANNLCAYGAILHFLP